MNDTTRIILDKEELLRVTKIIFTALDENKVPNLLAGAAMQVMLDSLRESGTDIRAVQFKSFKDEQ